MTETTTRMITLIYRCGCRVEVAAEASAALNEYAIQYAARVPCFPNCPAERARARRLGYNR